MTEIDVFSVRAEQDDRQAHRRMSTRLEDSSLAVADTVLYAIASKQGERGVGKLIHINGAPGVGKLTVARRMAARLQARVLDNHAIYNVAFALTDFRSPGFYDAVRALRAAAYDQILRLPDNETVILTDAYFDDTDWGRESWSVIDLLADQRGWPFFSIALVCEAAEHRRRIVNEERAGRGKLQDASYVDRAVTRRLIENVGGLCNRLDTTDLSADYAASILVDWIEASVQPRSDLLP